MAEPWHNGSGSVAARPARRAAPRNEDERLLREIALYPRAREFCAVRRKLDPQGKFANDPLPRLFDLTKS